MLRHARLLLRPAFPGRGIGGIPIACCGMHPCHGISAPSGVGEMRWTSWVPFARAGILRVRACGPVERLRLRLGPGAPSCAKASAKTSSTSCMAAIARRWCRRRPCIDGADGEPVAESTVACCIRICRQPPCRDGIAPWKPVGAADARSRRFEVLHNVELEQKLIGEQSWILRSSIRR